MEKIYGAALKTRNFMW